LARVMAVVPAAGQGSRMGFSVKKQYLSLAGLPLLGHVLGVLEACPVISGVVVVAAPGEVEFCRDLVVGPLGCKKIMAVVAGGQTRQESVYNALAALPPDTNVVRTLWWCMTAPVPFWGRRKSKTLWSALSGTGPQPARYR